MWSFPWLLKSGKNIMYTFAKWTIIVNVYIIFLQDFSYVVSVIQQKLSEKISRSVFNFKKQEWINFVFKVNFDQILFRGVDLEYEDALNEGKTFYNLAWKYVKQAKYSFTSDEIEITLLIFYKITIKWTKFTYIFMLYIFYHLKTFILIFLILVDIRGIEADNLLHLFWIFVFSSQSNHCLFIKIFMDIWHWDFSQGWWYNVSIRLHDMSKLVPISCNVS